MAQKLPDSLFPPRQASVLLCYLCRHTLRILSATLQGRPHYPHLLPITCTGRGHTLLLVDQKTDAWQQDANGRALKSPASGSSTGRQCGAEQARGEHTDEKHLHLLGVRHTCQKLRNATNLSVPSGTPEFGKGARRPPQFKPKWISINMTTYLWSSP